MPLSLDRVVQSILIGLFVLLQQLTLGLCDLSLTYHALSNKLLAVFFEDWLHGLHFLVHQWLGESWLIQLVVPVFTVPHNIDEDVLVEPISILICYFHALIQKIGFVGVYVEYGCANHLGDFCAVVSGTSLVLVGSESDLIVHDYVDNTARRVILEILHFERFVDDTLSSHCSITMDDDSHCFIERLFRDLILDGSNSPIYQWVDSLQMGRVGYYRERHLLSFDILH